VFESTVYLLARLTWESIGKAYVELDGSEMVETDDSIEIRHERNAFTTSTFVTAVEEGANGTDWPGTGRLTDRSRSSSRILGQRVQQLHHRCKSGCRWWSIYHVSTDCANIRWNGVLDEGKDTVE
jgi:hypothetical protein